MHTEWIILIAVLLLAGVAGYFVIRRYERKERPWQVKASVESERRIAAAKERDRVASVRLKDDPDPEHQQPDIPVWRDKPTIQPKE